MNQGCYKHNPLQLPFFPLFRPTKQSVYLIHSQNNQHLTTVRKIRHSTHNSVLWMPKMALLQVEAIPALSWSPLRLSTSYLSTSTIVALCVFFALLCACVIIGHLLEENRWVNESITALLLVLSSFFSTHNYVFPFYLNIRCNLKILHGLVKWMQGLCSGVVVLLVTKFHSTKLLIFSENLFFLYLLPPIIFNAG